jgi:phosphoribosylaminoimidazolecarboxamide formyltransferase/IMP cyclohydrolase
MTARVKRALLSVFDKTGLVEFARGLAALDVEIVSTGGTARELAQAGLRIREVADVTGFPEMLSGRVKTLHPRIHGGLLGVRHDPDHQRQMKEHGIEPIDLLAVNLYPFESTLREHPGDEARLIEMIDIGGPAMVRSASKNFASVTVVVRPEDYPMVLEELRREGEVSAATRRRLAARAFAHTAAYDALIAGFLRGAEDEPRFPAALTLGFRKALDLRYGENPHQEAALYRDPLDPAPGAVSARVLQGKELSFNNILDLDAAWALVGDLPRPACAIIKHTNPAGVAVAATPAMAWGRALAADPVSAFGGIVAFNRPLDEETARAMGSLFLEAIIAPGIEAGAAEALRGRKNLRVLDAGGPAGPAGGLDYKRVAGGLLVQQRDALAQDDATLRVVTRRAPTDVEMESLRFAWTVVRHVKSNAIVFARDGATLGVGAGQMSRVDAVRLAVTKSAAPLAGSVMASDAFFPFRDGLDEAARAGATAVIQPGGSVKDAEVIQAADEHGVAMVFTGRRHFRH